MDYSLEELLPIVARLSERYTRKESSSVTYETAEMLMEAVLTCVREGLENGDRAVAGGEKPKAEQIYQRGRERIEEKAQEAKRIYEELMSGWEDYGCLNYRDTVRTGMMEFFSRYDVQFQPQNHLLTLDYPLLCPLPQQCGADLILGYLKRVRIEKAFLDCFRREQVIRLMDRVSPDGRKNYMGNLCELVLLAACGRMIADQPVGELMLNSRDLDEIQEAFSGAGRPEAEAKVRWFLRRIGEQVPCAGTAGYLEQAAPGFAARIFNGIQSDCLGAVFFIQEFPMA